MRFEIRYFFIEIGLIHAGSKFVISSPVRQALLDLVQQALLDLVHKALLDLVQQALLYLGCMCYYIRLHALLYLGCVPYSVASKVQILVKSLNISKF